MSESLTFEEEGLCDLFRLTEYHKFDPIVRESVRDSCNVMVTLGPPLFALSLLQNGGQMFHKQFYYALHPTWIHKTVHHGKSNLFLKTGVRIDTSSDGRSTRILICDFVVPPAIIYFVNFLGPNPWVEYPNMKLITKMASNLEIGFIGAMSSSRWIEPDINDKLFTRCLMKLDQKIHVPDFVAFKTGHSKSLLKNEVFDSLLNKSIFVIQDYIPLTPIEDSQYVYSGRRLSFSEPSLRKLISEKIEEFLQQFPEYDEVVVKPSGTRFCGCTGVKIFSVRQLKHELSGSFKKSEEASLELKRICEHLVLLLKDSRQEDSVLVDGRIVPPFVQLNQQLFDGPDTLRYIENWDWVLRVVCCRNLENGGMTTGVVARVAKFGSPVNAGSEGGFWAQVENAFERAGLDFSLSEKDISQLGRDFFESWDLFENRRKNQLGEGEAENGQTDMVGLDVMMKIQHVGGKAVPIPVVIEVNDHDCGGSDAFDVLNALKKGQIVKPFLRNGKFFGELVYKKNLELFGKEIYEYSLKNLDRDSLNCSSESTSSIQEKNCMESDIHKTCNENTWPLKADNLYHCYRM